MNIVDLIKKDNDYIISSTDIQDIIFNSFKESNGFFFNTLVKYFSLHLLECGATNNFYAIIDNILKFTNLYELELKDSIKEQILNILKDENNLYVENTVIIMGKPIIKKVFNTNLNKKEIELARIIIDGVK